MSQDLHNARASGPASDIHPRPDRRGGPLPLSPPQCRAARAVLGWSQADLAQYAGVGRVTIVDFERGRRVAQWHNLRALRQAFEAEGMSFAGQDEVRWA